MAFNQFCLFDFFPVNIKGVLINVSDCRSWLVIMILISTQCCHPGQLFLAGVNILTTVSERIEIIKMVFTGKNVTILYCSVSNCFPISAAAGVLTQLIHKQ